MALPGVYNLDDMYKGDTFGGVTFTLQIDSGGFVDLTSAAIRSVFRRGSDTGTIIKDLSIGSGITVVDAVGGEFSIDAFDVDFSKGCYFYDVEIVDSGVIRTYVRGTFNVKQDVTYG